ncbi:CoA transferase, partial [Salmonella enterica subsp. enterica serovar Istanbul]|nr:CoA transferase [Salmonella enterica subsp. enterica serovar Istanbul]
LNLVADFGGGAMFLAFGMLSALLNVQRGGAGQVVDAAMVDGAASLSTIFYGLRAMGQWRPGREQNFLDGGAHFYGVYETKDGLW